MKKRSITTGILVAVVLVAVLATGLVSRLTDGFTVLNPKDVFTPKLNDENAFFGQIEDREIFDNYEIDAVAKDGVITMSGEVLALDSTGLTYSDPINIATLKLKKGTYTFTCFDDPSVKSYFAVGQYTVAGATHTWFADYENIPGIDFGAMFGTTHERTLTLDEDTTITFKIMIAEGAKLDKVKVMPVIVEGDEVGNFYLGLLD